MNGVDRYLKSKGIDTDYRLENRREPGSGGSVALQPEPMRLPATGIALFSFLTITVILLVYLALKINKK